MTLQAPELLHDFPVSSFSDRATSYCELLASEWSMLNSMIHLVGYSHSGPLAFEVALCVNREGELTCGSLCLIDPLPFCPRLGPVPSFLLQRASHYDFAFATLLLTKTSLTEAVTLEDITSLADLE